MIDLLISAAFIIVIAIIPVATAAIIWVLALHIADVTIGPTVRDRRLRHRHLRPPR